MKKLIILIFMLISFSNFIIADLEDICLPSLIQTAISEHGIRYAHGGCDGNLGQNDSDSWGSDGALHNFPTWWQFDLGLGVTRNVSIIEIMRYQAGGGITAFLILGSNDNFSSSDTLYSDNHPNDSDFHNYTLTTTGQYRYYRLRIDSSISGDGWTGLTEMRAWSDVEDEAKTSSINILFSNITDTNIYKDVFDESENFLVYINWTEDDNNIPLNSSVGICNITLYNSLSENKSLIINFSLCNSGCDYDSISDNLSAENGALTSIEDLIILDGICHNNIIAKDLSIDYECGANSGNINIDKSSFPQCPSTARIIRNLSGDCLSDIEIKITLDNDAISVSQSHFIEEFKIDREYLKHSHSSIDTDIIFDSSLDLWKMTIDHEYYKHGTKTIHANCSHNNSGYDNSLSSSIYIVDTPTEIFIEQLNNTGGFQNITNNSIYEYYDGAWQWFGAVVDNELDYFNVTWSNKTSIIQSYLNLTGAINFETDDNLFKDFDGNPYYINVTAVDIYGNVTTRFKTFNVTDLHNPICSGFDNSSVTNKSNYVWDVLCSDESLFYFNVTCDNGFEYAIDELDETSFYFGNSTTIYNDTICEWEVCDGHTLNSIPNIIITEETSHYRRGFDNKIYIESDKELSGFKFNKQIDRYIFEINPTYTETEISFTITSDEFIYVMDSRKYMGWIITGDYWIDFVSDDVSSSEVLRVSNNEVVIKLTFKNGIDDITFNSIGRLNCISGSQLIGATPSTQLPDEFGIFDEVTCPLEQEFAWVFGFFGIVAFLFMIYFVNEIWLKIPIFNIFIGLAFLVLAFPIWACSWYMSVPFFLFSFFIMLSELYR